MAIEINCRDATGNERSAIVFGDESGCAVMVAPAGGVGVFCLEQISALRTALMSAVSDQDALPAGAEMVHDA